MAGSLWMAARLSTAATALALLFGFGAARQAVLLYSGKLPAWEPSAAASGELAVLCIALSGLGALRSLLRTTRDRDRAEDLHWDSMETVRVMGELATRPGAEISDSVSTMLGVGATRFELELGVAWHENRAGEVELIGLRAPDGKRDKYADALLTKVRPRLLEVSRGTRPQVFVDTIPEPRVFFGTRVPAGDDSHGLLAFAGSRDPDDRLTGTDKDLLGLMAQWLGAELERRSRPASMEMPVAEAAPVPPPDPTPLSRFAALRPRHSRDLNTAVRRAERALRRRVGADATLEIALDPELPAVRGGKLSLSTLVESTVLAVASLAPTGRLKVETRSPEENTSDLLLRVSVAGDVDAKLLKQSYEQAEDAPVVRGSLSVPRLERLLRNDGGDLSVSIEPGRAAVLTAYLPAVQRDAPGRSRPATAQPSV